MAGIDSAHNLVIVAIPREDDYVWKISSEKVPHLTICFLGDEKVANVSKIEDFVGHVAKTSLHRFGMSVDRRGLLGEKDADVLFFHPNKMLETARSYLLAESNIKAAYNSVSQYPTWTPHLTLGYPETPAKPDNRDYPGITWVEFDRIALWTGDYEGPEFRLDDNMSSDLSMADEVENFLKHFGIKGMKWGVRRKRSSEHDSEDAKAALEAARKVKKHGSSSLSNKELQALVTRMNLEQQLSKLQTQKPSTFQKGKKAVQEILSVGQLANQTIQLINSPAVKTLTKSK